MGVSGDPQETSDRFRKSLDLPYPLVGDAAGHVTRDYKVRWPLIGISQRVTYVIGRNKQIRLAFHSEFDIGAHTVQACEIAAHAGA